MRKQQQESYIMQIFMRFLILILLSVFWIPLSYAKNDPSLEKTIHAVVLGFQNRNAEQVKPYIHPKYGYVYWYRIGIPTIQTYEQRKDFIFPAEGSAFPNIWHYSTPHPKKLLQKTMQLPIMECDLWNKSGWFYQQSHVKKAFRQVLKNNYRDQLIDKEALEKGLKIVQPLEKNLVEMYYIGSTRQVSDSLHLYFSQINGKWYLSGFDNGGNCDV